MCYGTVIYFLVSASPDPSSHYVITLKAFNNMGEGIPVYESAITRPQSGIHTHEYLLDINSALPINVSLLVEKII